MIVKHANCAKILSHCHFFTSTNFGWIWEFQIIFFLAEPEPDENGVMISNYHGVQRKVYNPLISANGGLLYYRPRKLCRH